MAQAKHSQAAVRPRGGPSLRQRSYPRAPVVACVALVALILAAALLTGPDTVAVSATRDFLAYYSGVFSLVALSVTVMGGVAATDRTVLLVRHRVLLQAVHRATATASMGFLAVHVAMKMLEGHARLLDAIVPFLATHRAVYVGLGTVASYLMILMSWTGIIRGWFAGVSFPWLWRLMHGGAYICWPIALAHGLKSGRSAAGWVTTSYALCLVLVGMALLVRLIASYGRRLRAPKAATTGMFRAVGHDAGTSSHTTPARTLTPEPASRRPEGDWPATHQPAAGWQDASVGRYADELPAIGGHKTAEHPVIVPRSVEPGPGSSPSTRLVTRQVAPRGTGSRSIQDISDEEFWAHLRGEAIDGIARP